MEGIGQTSLLRPSSRNSNPSFDTKKALIPVFAGNPILVSPLEFPQFLVDFSSFLSLRGRGLVVTERRRLILNLPQRVTAAFASKGVP